MERALYKIYNRESIIPILIACIFLFISAIFRNSIYSLLFFIFAIYEVEEIFNTKLKAIETEMLNKLPLGREIIQKISLKARLRAIITVGVIYTILNFVNGPEVIGYLFCGMAIGITLIFATDKYRNITRGSVMFVWVILSIFKSFERLKLGVVLLVIILLLAILKGIYVIIQKREIIKGLFK